MTISELQFVFNDANDRIVKRAEDSGLILTNILEDIKMFQGKDENSDIVEFSYCTKSACYFVIYEWDKNSEVFNYLDNGETPII